MPSFKEFPEEEIFVFNKTLTSDSFITKLASKTITSDAHIKTTSTKTITEDMFLGYLGQTKTITTDSVIKKLVYDSSINSDAHLLRSFRIVKTDVTEALNVTPSTIKFTPTKSVSLYHIQLKCRGATGTEAEIYLTCNTINSDTINIGNSSSAFSYHKFTFATPVTVSSSETTITITASQGSISIKSGPTDNSGWGVTEQ